MSSSHERERADRDDFDEAVNMSALAQRPDGDATDTRWRYSLMNWGHDPVA